MYGVVLWSDLKDQKAVIWCEDHGDLAFYSAQGDSALDGEMFDAGDLVHFQLTEGAELRLATNPRVIAGQQYHDLAETLLAKSEQAPDGADHQSGEVIAFRPREASKSVAC